MSLPRKIGKVALYVIGGLVVLVGGYLAYAVATAKGRLSFPNAPFPQNIAASKDPAVIERGRYLVYGPAHCAQCHSVTDRDHPELVVPGIALSGGLEFAMGPIGVTYAANLTSDPETGIGKRSDAELARAIRTGVLHDGTFSVLMRFAVGHLSDADLGAVISYLRSVPPVRNAVRPGQWGLLGKAMLPLVSMAPREVTGPQGAEPGAEPTLERGRYLAENVALCVGCHSAVDMKTFQPVGPKAGGGTPEGSHGKDSDYEFVTPNLTSHPTGYTGRADEAAFLARLKSGRALPTSIMPWESLKQMTDVDLRSIYMYLRSLPAVDNDVGPSYRKKGWKRPAS